MELGEISIAHALRFGHIGECLQSPLAILLRLLQVLLHLRPALGARGAIVVSQQRQRPDVVRVDLQHPVGGVDCLLGVVGFETHPCQRQTTSRPKSILPIAWHARHRCRPSRFHRTTPFSCDTPYWSDSYSSEAG